MRSNSSIPSIFERWLLCHFLWLWVFTMCSLNAETQHKWCYAWYLSGQLPQGIFALDEDRWYLENQMTMRLSSWQSLRPRCYDARWAKKKKPTVILHCGTSDWRLQLQLNHNIQETLVNCMNYSQPAQTKFSTFLDQEGYYCLSVWAMSDL